MSVPASNFFNMRSLRRYDGPGFFLGGGFVVGMLVFLVWMASLPDDERGALRARGNGVVGASAPAAPGGGVLGDITGEGAAARSGAAKSDPDFYAQDDASPEAGELAQDPRFEDGYAPDPDAMAIGEDVGEPPMDEGAALTDSLLGPAMPPGTMDAGPYPAGPALLPWYVEVEVAPGQVQVLQLNAESPEHALAILRDFRGDPRVLRGPTTEPLR